MKTTRSNIRDWSFGTPFEPPLSRYQTIAACTPVVRGGNGHPAMMRIADLLAANILQASLETISGGSHFLPATHLSELAHLIDAHVRKSAG